MSNYEILDLYLKTKKDWDTRASVRTSKETYNLNFTELQKNEDLNWHVPSYSAILNHKCLENLSHKDKKYVMGIQLLEFVEKTAIFEIEYVNKVANNLALGNYKFDIPNILKLDALKIYTDEGFHAHFSKKMADDIKEYYNINDDISLFTKSFFNQIKSVGSNFDKKFNYLSELSSTIVSESMIVQDMSDEMRGIVYEPIRVMFRDHIIDEAFHANYFSTIFKILWPQFSNIEKEIMGANLCDSIAILAKPRVDIYYYSLGKLGFEKECITKFIEETYDNLNTEFKPVNKRMMPILDLLKRCEVFKTPSIYKKFKDQGFIK